MARQKPADKVESLRRQQAGITAKLKEAEAREKGAEKALTERRRQVAGAVALGMIRREPDGAFAAAFRVGRWAFRDLHLARYRRTGRSFVDSCA